MTISKFIASVSGIGLIGKGAGTIAAVATVAIWVGCGIASLPIVSVVAVIAIITIVGVVVAHNVQADWGKDSQKVVIDELAGMGIALIGLPGQWGYVVAAFLLFRMFDIAKPFGIRRMESLPGGWGVMGDDVLAGVYANIILQVVHRSGVIV